MISLEPICFIVRKGEKHEKYGDPFEDVGFLVKISDSTLMLKGYVGDPTLDTLKKLKKLVLPFGFTEITWERKNQNV